MQVRELMTENPVCCARNETIQHVAALMVEHDCGEIPVVDELDRPIGVVTDRDICCRAVARGRAVHTLAREVMTEPAVTARPDEDVEDCLHLMKQYQIRRVPVVDQEGVCCGIVAQADIARHAGNAAISDVVAQVSSPAGNPSQVR